MHAVIINTTLDRGTLHIRICPTALVLLLAWQFILLNIKNLYLLRSFQYHYISNIYTCTEGGNRPHTGWKWESEGYSVTHVGFGKSQRCQYTKERWRDCMAARINVFTEGVS